MSNQMRSKEKVLPPHPCWMFPHKCSKTNFIDVQNQAVNAPTYIDYLCQLNFESKVAKKQLTGIICTLNTKHANSDFINQLLLHGVRMVSVDISTGNLEDLEKLINCIRIAVQNFNQRAKLFVPLSIAAEITQLRIRTGKLKDRSYRTVELKENENVFITIDDRYKCHCGENYIYVDYPEILKKLNLGDLICINYGDIVLEVVEKAQDKIKCIIKQGGNLHDYSTVQLPDLPEEISDFLRDDLIEFAVSQEVDAIVFSDVKHASTISTIKTNLGNRSKGMLFFAKIENMSALHNIDEIIDESDGIIISRGELTISLPSEKLFIVQKSITAKCNKQGKIAICSSFILDSMSQNHHPTRSEALDASNIVLDGADCLQLSENIMEGIDPIGCIEKLNNICLEAEAAFYQSLYLKTQSMLNKCPHDPTISIVLSAVDLSVKHRASCIIVMTASGRTAKLASKFRPRCPILALTRLSNVARKLNYFRGVTPIYYVVKAHADWNEDVKMRVQYAIKFGQYKGFISIGDVLIVLCGWKKGAGFTNTVRVIYA